MNPANNISTINILPEDMQRHISTFLTPKELGRCSQVCRAWRKLFDSDIMWESTAKKLGVEKPAIRAQYLQDIQNTWIFNRLPQIIKRHLSNDYKSLTCDLHQHWVQEFIEECPKELLDVFNGPSNLLQLPSIELNFPDDLESYVLGGLVVHYRFQNAYFSSPIVRATIKYIHSELRTLYILFKIKNNITGEIHREAINIFSFCGDRFFSDLTDFDDRIICSGYPDVTAQKLERLQRLIQGQPVGTITNESRRKFIEGPRITSDGRSVFELCRE